MLSRLVQLFVVVCTLGALYVGIASAWGLDDLKERASHAMSSAREKVDGATSGARAAVENAQKVFKMAQKLPDLVAKAKDGYEKVKEGADKIQEVLEELNELKMVVSPGGIAATPIE